MSCGHTVCRRCHFQLVRANQRSDSLACPVCRSPTKVEGRMPVNYILKDIVGQVKRQQSLERLPCSSCDESINPQKILLCRTCSPTAALRQEIICGHCGFLRHSGHKLVSLHLASTELRNNAKKTILRERKSTLEGISSLTDAVEVLKQHFTETIANYIRGTNVFFTAETRINDAFMPLETLGGLEKNALKEGEELKRKVAATHAIVARINEELSGERELDMSD
ncbi:hypothetical protein L596_028652 [Steinernema carpocapsae]|uniref:RING-type domain-containing protein n=2 Tax=Steinernema carpocapsae TaxID=34508 RepID=A0A4U5LZ33_STECR|nr:hypothetical protein L596_028652 [Steinernema carpocapsae]